MLRPGLPEPASNLPRHLPPRLQPERVLYQAQHPLRLQLHSRR
jgi:hypothetical protein